jgi:hypothetical protein
LSQEIRENPDLEDQGDMIDKFGHIIERPRTPDPTPTEVEEKLFFERDVLARVEELMIESDR